MILQKDEYKIENNGIWISKKALEEWMEHYLDVSGKHKQDLTKSKGNFKLHYFLGKSAVLIDLLKMFEDVEERWDIIDRIERHREIATYFAKLRHQATGNTIHNIIVTQDKQGNLVNIKQKYPPHIEKALKEIEELENLALDKKKTTNHYVTSKDKRTRRIHQAACRKRELRW